MIEPKRDIDRANARLAELNKITELTKSRYAGVLGNGNIVDRREHPNAIPIPKNSLFGTPDPKPIPSHPEDFCQRCKGPNPVWFTTNEFWNNCHGTFNILCPNCFLSLAKDLGLNPVWKIEPENLE